MVWSPCAHLIEMLGSERAAMFAEFRSLLSVLNVQQTRDPPRVVYSY